MKSLKSLASYAGKRAGRSLAALLAGLTAYTAGSVYANSCSKNNCRCSDSENYSCSLNEKDAEAREKRRKELSDIIKKRTPYDLYIGSDKKDGKKELKAHGPAEIEHLDDIGDFEEGVDYTTEEKSNDKDYDSAFFDYGGLDEDDEESNEFESKNKAGLGYYLLTVPAAYALSVFWHETGHALLAKSFGAEKVHYSGPNWKKGRVAAVSYRFPRGKRIGQLQETLISSGGVLFTTAGSLVLENMISNDIIADEAKPFVAATALIMMFDRWRYVFSSLAHFMYNRNGMSDDIYAVLSTNFKSEEAIAGAYGLLALGTCIEIGLRWDEVDYLFNTAIGENPKPPSSKFHFNFSFDGDTAQIGFGGSF